MPSLFSGLEIDDIDDNEPKQEPNNQNEEVKETTAIQPKKKKNKKKKKKKEAAKDNHNDDNTSPLDLLPELIPSTLEETTEFALTLKKSNLNPKKELALMFEEDDQKEETKESPSSNQYQLSRRAKKFVERHKAQTNKIGVKNKLFIRSCEEMPPIIPKIAQLNVISI